MCEKINALKEKEKKKKIPLRERGKGKEGQRGEGEGENLLFIWQTDSTTEIVTLN